MNQHIVDAIKNKRRIAFVYNGKRRIVEPQCHGLGTRGTSLMRGVQIEGGAQREPLFDVSKMHDLVTLDDVFSEPGPNYKRDDSAMRTIFAQL